MEENLMLFPSIDINPLAAVIVYDIKGLSIYQLENIVSENENRQIDQLFIRPLEFNDWVRRYKEITIFRGAFRATYITFLDVTILFVSRINNIAPEIRPIINKFVYLLGRKVLLNLEKENKTELNLITIWAINQPEAVKEDIFSIFSRLGIDKITPPTPIAQKEAVKKLIESQVKTFESLKPFESVPQIPVAEMTQEILDDAIKRAATSLLFSSIRSCESPSAAAYIFPKEDGAIGELYAGNLEEKKIVYVLETISKFPKVINEMVHSKDNIKVLNAEVVQIIVEECYDGRILIGMTTNVSDVINVAYKFKIIKIVLKNMGL